MSLANTDNKVTYQGNGATAVWPFSFPVLEKAHLKVILTNTAGTETTLTSDYVVDLINKVVNYPGYESGQAPPEINQPPKLPEGWKITLLREVPLTQETDLGEKWPFKEIEDTFDRTTMQIQQLAEKANRAILTPVTGDGGDSVPTIFGELADAAVTSAMTGANGGHMYVGIDSDDDAYVDPDAGWIKALPLPLSTPSAADAGKAILVSSDGLSYTHGTVTQEIPDLTAYEQKANRDVANGYPTLNSSGQLSYSKLDDKFEYLTLEGTTSSTTAWWNSNELGVIVDRTINIPNNFLGRLVDLQVFIAAPSSWANGMWMGVPYPVAQPIGNDYYRIGGNYKGAQDFGTGLFYRINIKMLKNE